ncbi:MAG: ComEC/Rec2 family competence protein [Cytophagales bacterium]
MFDTIFNALNKYPFLKISVSFTLGILVYLFQIKPIELFTYYSITLVLGFIILNFFKQTKNFYSFLLLSIFTLFSYTICWIKDEKSSKNYILKYPNIEIYKGKISSQLSKNTFLIETKSVKSGKSSSYQQCSGTVAVYFKELDSKIKIGNYISIKGHPQCSKPNQNPEEFNYSLYLKSKNTYAQQYLKPNQYQITESTNLLDIRQIAEKCRMYISQIFQEKITNKTIAAIAEGLILGTKNNIENELVNAYTTTGTIHILAVSGMHVSLFFLLIGYCINLFGFARNNVWVLLFSIIIIWAFALVTGLGASVLRASVMFTIYQIGKILGKKVALKNVAFVTVFIILISNPFMILDIGFQLSLTAVLGILYIHPIFQKLFETKNKFVQFIYDTLTVTFSAQLAVLPLSMFYFHQFPNLFLISNLFAITLSTISLYVGIASILIHKIPIVNTLCFKSLEICIDTMNKIICTIAQFPFSISKVYIDYLDLCIISVSILFFTIWFKEKSKKYFWAFVIVILILFSKILFNDYTLKNSTKIIVYSFPKTEIVDIYTHGSLKRFITNTTNLSNKINQTIEINSLKNTLENHSQQTQKLGLSCVLRFKPKLFPTRNLKYSCNDVFYIMTHKIPKELPAHTFFIVKTLKNKKELLTRGIHLEQIHCLQEQGAFTQTY